MELVNGNIVNEFDEIVGKYYHIMGNLYRLNLYDNSEEITRKKMIDKIEHLDLFFEPVWN